MSAALEHEVFAKQVNTKFRIRVTDTESVEAELVEVSEHLVSAQQERFSLVFRGPNEVFLGQGQRTFEHDEMGEFVLFIVPIGRDEGGTSYEAVFNRLPKKK